MRVPKYWRALLLGLVASLLAIYFIASQMKDVGQMWSALRSADYRWILVSMGIIVIGLFVRGARWRALLDWALPFWRAFSITNVSYLLSGVLPLRLGEVARIYLATQARPPVPPMKSISSILVERLIDLLAVLIILALALSAGPLPDQLRTSATFFIPIVVIGFVILLLMASQRAFTLRIAGQMLARISFLQRWNILAWLEQFLDGLKPLTQPSALVQVIPLTIGSWVCSLASGYVLMIAFFGHADWATTCLFSAAASLAIAVPAVPGNLGTYELSILLALRAMGYGDPVATATAFAIAVHGVNLIVNSSLGVYGFIQEGISLDQLSHGVREMRKPSG